MFLTELAKLAPGVSEGHHNSPHRPMTPHNEHMAGGMRFEGRDDMRSLDEGRRLGSTLKFSDSSLNSSQYSSGTHGDHYRLEPQGNFREPMFANSEFSRERICTDSYHLQSDDFAGRSVVGHGERRVTGLPYDSSGLDSSTSELSLAVGNSSSRDLFHNRSCDYSSERRNLEGLYEPEYGEVIAHPSRRVETNESYPSYTDEYRLMKFDEHDTDNREHFALDQRQHLNFSDGWRTSTEEKDRNESDRDVDKHIHQSTSFMKYSESADSGYIKSDSSVHGRLQDRALLKTHSENRLYSRKRKRTLETVPQKQHKPDSLHLSHTPRSQYSGSQFKVSNVQNRLGPQPLLNEEKPRHQVKPDMEDLRMQLTKKFPSDEKKPCFDMRYSPTPKFEHEKTTSNFSSKVDFSSPSKSVTPLLPAEPNPLSDSGVKFSAKSISKVSTSLSKISPKSATVPVTLRSTDDLSSNKDFHQAHKFESAKQVSDEPVAHLKYSQSTVETSTPSRVDTIHQRDQVEIKSCSNSTLELPGRNKVSKKVTPNLSEHITPPYSGMASRSELRPSESKVSSIFPLFGSGAVAQLPFSESEVDKKEYADSGQPFAERTSILHNAVEGNDDVKSDSESEGELIIDINHVTDSPAVTKSSAVVSTLVHSSTEEPKNSAVVTFKSQAKPEYLKIAEEVLSGTIVHELSMCCPNPLDSLYRSIDIVLGSINRWKLSMPTVQHAFRSFTMSKRAQPWTLPELFKAELISLGEGCKEDVEKWKSSANVFSSILSSLLNKPGKELTSKLSLECSISLKSSVEVESRKVALKSIEEIPDAVVHSTIESDDSLGTDSNECNMSVCSTVSDGEIISVEMSNPQFGKSGSLSPGELTPTPPSSPQSCSPLSIALNPLRTNTGKVSNGQHISFFPADSKAKTEGLLQSHKNVARGNKRKSKLKSKSISNKSKEEKIELESHKDKKDQGNISRKSNRTNEKQQGGLHSSKSHTQGRLTSSSFNDIHRRHSSDFAKRLRSPAKHSDYSKVSRHRHVGSCSPVSKKRGRSNRRKYSRSPEITSSKSRGSELKSRCSRSPKGLHIRKGNQKYKKSISRDLDDDIELLQLKKEVILSIVKKPENESLTNASVSVCEPSAKFAGKCLVPNSDKDNKSSSTQQNNSLCANSSAITSETIKSESYELSSIETATDQSSSTIPQEVPLKSSVNSLLRTGDSRPSNLIIQATKLPGKDCSSITQTGAAEETELHVPAKDSVVAQTTKLPLKDTKLPSRENSPVVQAAVKLPSKEKQLKKSVKHPKVAELSELSTVLDSSTSKLHNGVKIASTGVDDGSKKAVSVMVCFSIATIILIKVFNGSCWLSYIYIYIYIYILVVCLSTNIEQACLV